jgi:hypothetical protein
MLFNYYNKMYLISFVLLGLAITGLLYGTTNVWANETFTQETIELIKQVRFAPTVEKEAAKRQNISDDLVSSPPDL